MKYRHTFTLGGKGRDRHQFRTSLLGLAFGPDGLLYATGDRMVKVFEVPSGRLVRLWPTARPGRSIAVTKDGEVWVGQAEQIEIFDGEGRRQSLWQDAKLLGIVTAVDFYQEELFVADAAGRAIRRFSKDRVHKNDIGTDSPTRGFVLPNGHLDFQIDSDGVIFAAHPGKHRVERYSADGKLLGRFGHFGMRNPADFRGCCNPTNLALTADRKVVVTEKAGPRAKVFTAEGELLAVMDERYFDPNCRNMDIAVDSQGNIYVADTVRLHVLVFTPVEEEADLPKQSVNA